MQEHESFWSEIKACEELLAANPDSYCFARLSAVYLKVGLVDDALHAARAGVARHPAFVGGLRALCQASAARGDVSGERAALLRLTEAVPEDIASQRRLGRLLDDSGDTVGALRAFRTALEFFPDDDECRIERDLIERRLHGQTSLLDEAGEAEEILEDMEVIEDVELVEEESVATVEETAETVLSDRHEEVAAAAPSHQDPLSTATLAELYVQQGFVDKALVIYRAIVSQNPADAAACARLAELETFLPPETAAEGEQCTPLAGPEDMFLPVEEPAALAAEVPAWQADEPPAVCTFEAALPSSGAADVTAVAENVVPSLPAHGHADHAVQVLEGWLENIRRIKSCR